MSISDICNQCKGLWLQTNIFGLWFWSFFYAGLISVLIIQLLFWTVIYTGVDQSVCFIWEDFFNWWQVTMHTDWRAFEVIINRAFQSQVEEVEGSPSTLSVSLDVHNHRCIFSMCKFHKMTYTRKCHGNIAIKSFKLFFSPVHCQFQTLSFCFRVH